MNSANKAFVERVVYAGLRRMSDDRSTIQSGYRFWQVNLAGDPFDVIDLVEKMANFLGLATGEKKRLMISLYAASAKLHDELEPLPGYLGGGDASLNVDNSAEIQDSQSDVVVKAIAPHIDAIAEYISILSKFIRRTIKDEYEEYVTAVEELAGEFSDGIDKAIRDFGRVQPGKLAFPESMSEQNARSLAQHFHLLASEFVGPMEGDRLHYQTVEQLLGMEFANRFDPRTLL